MNKTDRDTFIMENMGLVGMIVNKHIYRIADNPSIDREDLVNIGAIGLIKAYDRFNPDYGTQFSTYAVPIIDGEIKRHLRDNSDTIRFSRGVKRDYYKIIELELLNEDIEVIANTLDITIERVQKALDYHRCQYVSSIDNIIHEGEDTPITLADKIGIDIDFDTSLELELFLNKLDERGQKIVGLRLQGRTQAEIGQILGISQTQVSRELLKIQSIYKKGNHETVDKVVEKKDRKICPNFTLAKKLAEESEINPSQISKKTGVAYTTARNYVNSYRKVKEKSTGSELNQVG